MLDVTKHVQPSGHDCEDQSFVVLKVNFYSDCSVLVIDTQKVKGHSWAHGSISLGLCTGTVSDSRTLLKSSLKHKKGSKTCVH